MSMYNVRASIVFGLLCIRSTTRNKFCLVVPIGWIPPNGKEFIYICLSLFNHQLPYLDHQRAFVMVMWHTKPKPKPTYQSASYIGLSPIFNLFRFIAFCFYFQNSSILLALPTVLSTQLFFKLVFKSYVNIH